MRLVPLFAFVSLSSLLCHAQTVAVPAHAATADRVGAVVLQAPISQACPIEFQARRSQDGGLVAVSRGHQHAGTSYLLTFLPHSGATIAQARITLHGISGQHVIPVRDQGSAEATESFSLSPSTGTKPHLFRSTVYTEKLTGVQWIELNELTYADGTVWRESASETCRVAPNGFMLVAAGR